MLRGEIRVVNLAPVVGSEADKRQPAVIVSDDDATGNLVPFRDSSGEKDRCPPGPGLAPIPSRGSRFGDVTSSRIVAAAELRRRARLNPSLVRSFVSASRPGPGPACVMRAQRDMVHPASRHASSARQNPPAFDPREHASHNASPGDITKTTPPGRGAPTDSEAGWDDPEWDDPGEPVGE